MTPYTWSLISGSLPTGLSLGSAGTISGTPSAAGAFNFTVQATDSGSPVHTATKSLSISVTGSASCPCTIWPSNSVPSTPDTGADAPVEIGVSFRSDSNGYITALRFYKAAGNTGTHVGHLWNSSGTLLATATFANETASGWQQVNLSNAVAINANATYVASYHTNVGHYADDQNYFGAAFDNSPLHAPANTGSAPNGVYAYASNSAFPNQGWNSSNYWVDVVFAPSGTDNTPPTITFVSPFAGATGVNATSSVLVTFSEAIDPSTVSSTSFQLSDSTGALVPATVTYDANSSTAKLVPSTTLSYTSTYTALVKGGLIRDLAGNVLASNYTWSFTTAAAAPVSPNDGPGGPILIVSSSTNPFSRYYAEILRAEGFNEFLAMDISNVSSSMLANYDVVILGDFSLTASQVSMFSSWVSSGGNLIAIASITISAGSSSGTFTIYTSTVTSQIAVTITAAYGAGNKTAALTVNPLVPLVISTQSLPSGIASTPYSTTLVATGGTSPYAWSISSGSLPTGLTLSTSTGVISGTPTAAGTFTFTIKATDSGSPAQTATQAFTIAITAAGSCPCTIWPSTTVPTIGDSGADPGVELGVAFRVDNDGFITAIRFYKGTGNTGTHVGNLWSSTGTLLATATFTGETASGWQQVSFSSPVAIKANTLYVASYHTNVGHYADDQNFFVSNVDHSPLHAPSTGLSNGNGLYAYGSSSAFPNQTWHSSNYWVDVVYVSGTDTTPPTVTSVSPVSGATNVSRQTTVSATFSESLDPTTVTSTTFQLLDSGGTAVAATVSYSSGTNTATLTPSSALSNSSTYSALIKGGSVKDLAGNALAADYKWSFTTSAPSALVISTQSLPAGSTTVTYSATLAATGGTPPYSWSIASGSLPIGLSLGTSGVISGIPTVAGTFSFTVKVTDSGTPVQTATQASSISITAVGSTQYTIWPISAVPSIPDAGADSSVEIGVAFRADNNGYITGIRFYKGAGNVGTHVANLWTSTGALLASANFTNETASGWQQVTFTTPVAVTANSPYVASYHTSTGHYADDQYFFANSVDSVPLHAPATGLGSGNGVFAYGASSAFPNQSWHTSNYWVDVIFVPSS